MVTYLLTLIRLESLMLIVRIASTSIRLEKSTSPSTDTHSPPSLIRFTFKGVNEYLEGSRG